MTVGRLATVGVSIVAIALAWDPDSSILGLVSNAWAGFGSAFGPLVVLALFWKGYTRDGALASMIVGAVTVLVWLYVPLLDGEPLESLIYAMIPGFIFSTIAGVVVSLVTKKPSELTMSEFDTMEAKMNEVHGKGIGSII